MIFKNPAYYHLTSDSAQADANSAFKKIIDYLLTFPGDIAVKSEDGGALISYTGTPMLATLKPSGNLNRQITLTCEQDDTISVNLLKNITKTNNYRIFNPRTTSFLINDPAVLDLTNAQPDDAGIAIIEKAGLEALYQYRNSLVYYAKDAKGRIHLVNRHLLEFLIKHPDQPYAPADFSDVVADDIGRFVALMDRGLIPLSFYRYINEPKKIINLSGFVIEKLSRDVIVEQVDFTLDVRNQLFIQGSSDKREVKKGQSVTDGLPLKKILCVKVAQDISFSTRGQTLIPNLRLSVYFDA